jgi:hypothetical protein
VKAIQSLLKFRPSSDYIRNDTGLPWLKLNIDVPVNDIKKEYEQNTEFLVSHRSEDSWGNMSHKGWKSATIYGVDTHITTRTDDFHDWTSLSYKCPKTVQWIKDNFIINEKTRRIRFMLLEPGGFILPHADRSNTGLVEINVAITQPQNCCFRFLDRGTIPFEVGSAFIIDTSNRHMVWNNSDQYRLHMILHTRISNKILEDSYANSFYTT